MTSSLATRRDGLDGFLSSFELQRRRASLRSSFDGAPCVYVSSQGLLSSACKTAYAVG